MKRITCDSLAEFNAKLWELMQRGEPFVFDAIATSPYVLWTLDAESEESE